MKVRNVLFLVCPIALTTVMAPTFSYAANDVKSGSKSCGSLYVETIGRTIGQRTHYFGHTGGWNIIPTTSAPYTTSRQGNPPNHSDSWTLVAYDPNTFSSWSGTCAPL